MSRRRVLIIGAGVAGRMAAEQIAAHPELDLEVIGFVDDDPTLAGRRRFGLDVLGDRGAIESIVTTRGVEMLLLAIPSAEGEVVRKLLRTCRRVDAELRIVPGIREIVLGEVRWHQIRPIQPDDLLGREAVELRPSEAAARLGGKRVLVTGAGGSIGSELCRWACRSGAAEVALFGHAENELFELEEELAADHGDVPVRVDVADVRDASRTGRVLAARSPDIVFHAAAHKHVPLMEKQPDEAVKTNILGTRNVVDAAIAASVGRLVMLSTDKAVRPISVMGASKRIAEIMLQHRAVEMGDEPITRLAMVRFGNVLGSRGSVVPRFARQIERGGPVTVSHVDATRYFMTIKEAALLVVLAGARAQGGEVFVLDMGEQISILELAREMVAMSGRKVDIEISGLRAGEKLREELWTDEFAATEMPKVHLAEPRSPEAASFKEVLERLEQFADDGEVAGIRREMQRLVPELPDRLGETRSVG
ncbi:MAG: nucleoside-diphosphate sugar epimerase [Gemmatimonadetes bacterium]|nr:nucleoside-diphosphate sugar epimerase [Gemmatimonadota bacterium]